MQAPKEPRPTLLSRLVKGFLLALYRWKGWTLDAGSVAPRRCVILGAPHTTNWDFVFFLGAVTELGIKPSFMGKLSLFRAPLTRFMYDMGGIPIDRRAKDRNYVEQVALGAGVPIVPAWVDNATMRGGLGPAIEPCGDYDADLRRIALFYRSVMPLHPKLAVLYAETGLIRGSDDA
jgi:hypothetical protein